MRQCDGRRCNDDLGARVVGDLRGAADDGVGAFPGPLVSVEGYFLGHPVVLVERRLACGLVGQVGRGAIGGPGGGAPCCLPLVGLHPDQVSSRCAVVEVVVGVVSSGAVTTLAKSLQVWLSQRRADVALKVSGPEGREIVLDAKRIPDAERLLNTALGWAEGDSPMPPPPG